MDYAKASNAAYRHQGGTLNVMKVLQYVHEHTLKLEQAEDGPQEDYLKHALTLTFFSAIMNQLMDSAWTLASDQEAPAITQIADEASAALILARECFPQERFWYAYAMLLDGLTQPKYLLN